MIGSGPGEVKRAPVRRCLAAANCNLHVIFEIDDWPAISGAEQVPDRQSDLRYVRVTCE
jgi:hypothetical protein